MAVFGTLDRANASTATTGTGTMTLGAATSTSFQSWANAGAQNGVTYPYLISDGADREWGTGTYTTSGTTLARTTVAGSIIAGVSGTTKINLSGSATVACVDITRQLAALGNGLGPILPQGRLTLVTATPVMVSDQTAKTSVFYTPYQGNLIPICDGTLWSAQVFAELTMALDTSNQLLENVYDLFVWNNAGTISIGAGPAWKNTATVTWTSASPGVCSWANHGLYEGAPVIFTAGTSTPTGITAGTTYYVSKTGLTGSAFSVSTTVANAAAGTNVNTSSTGVGTQTGTNHTTVRGTGAGTTQITQTNGIWLNTNSITLTNGAGGGTAGVSALTATYVGSIYCTANGQTGMAFAPAAANGGANPILGVYNAYNRIRTTTSTADTTGGTDYTYNSATWRYAQGNVNNRAWWLDGLQQSPVTAINTSVIYNNGLAGQGKIGVTLDSTVNVPSFTNGGGGTSTVLIINTPCTIQPFFPQLGFHFAQRMESATAGTISFAGSGTNQQQNSMTLSLDM